jgi:hypothetical protein
MDGAYRRKCFFDRYLGFAFSPLRVDNPHFMQPAAYVKKMPKHLL